MSILYSIIDFLFGIQKPITSLTLLHFSMRAFLVYFVGIFLTRLQTQFVSISTPFNYILNILIGSLLANAIVGSGPYFPILGMCFLIFITNILIEILCYYSSFFEKLLKGKGIPLVRNGRILWDNMRKNLLTEDELMEAVREQIHEKSLSTVKEAYFENSGKIMVIKK
jgi:uncharacterized membrane protein YcaP (DUF421 family)